jgi:hypothetical protein
VAEAMEFPDEGINLTAHLDQLERPTWLKLSAELSGTKRTQQIC